MKKLFCFYWLLAITAGSLPPPVVAQPVSTDCAMCGHVCCCPEMCKPALEVAKKSCDASASMCELKPSGSPVGLINVHEKAERARPQLVVFGGGLRDFPDHLSSLADFPASEFSLNPADIHTPPPKLS